MVTQFSGSSPRDSLIQCVLGEAEESVFLINVSDDLDTARTGPDIWGLLSGGIVTETELHCLHDLNHTALVVDSSLMGYPRFSNTELKGPFSWEMLLAETTVFI